MAKTSTRRAPKRLTLEERVSQYLTTRATFFGHADLRHSEPRYMKTPQAVTADGRRFAGAATSLLRSASQRRGGRATPLVTACRRWARAYSIASKDSQRLRRKKWWTSRDYALSKANMVRLYKAERGLFDATGGQPSRRDPLNTIAVR